jgi:hypothetical protein
MHSVNPVNFHAIEKSDKDEIGLSWSQVSISLKILLRIENLDSTIAIINIYLTCQTFCSLIWRGNRLVEGPAL